MQIDQDIAAIRDILDDKTSGKTRKGLAKAMGIWPSGVTAMLDGRRKLAKEEVAKASAYLEVVLPSQGGVAVKVHQVIESAVLLAPVRGETAAGVWREFEQFDEEKYAPVPYAPTRYVGLEQFAYKVAGKSMDKENIYDGDYVICVPYNVARAIPTSGDVVVAERRQGNLFERTCKALTMSEKGKMMLTSRSSDPRYSEPLMLGENPEDVEVEIIGLVVGTYRPRFG